MDWEAEFDKTFAVDKSGEQVDGYLLMNTGKWVPGDDREWCKIATPEDVKNFIKRIVADFQREAQEKEGRERLLWVGRYTARQHSAFYCWLMNLIDFRYWGCECHYQAPYGLGIMAGCEKHD